VRPVMNRLPNLCVGRPTGRVKLTATSVETGEATVLLDIPNIVVDNLREQEAHLIVGDGVADRWIDRVSCGTDGTVETAADIALGAPAYTKLIASVSYPTARSVKFTVPLLAAEANGIAVREAGLILYNAAPALVARVTFPVMTKSARFAWTWEWTIDYPVSTSPSTLNTMLTQVCHLIAGDSTNRFITTMIFGTGSFPEDQAQTNLQMPITPTKLIGAGIVWPSAYLVQVTAYLLNTEANQFPIAEIGLATGDGTLVARKTQAAVVKDADHNWTFRWGIET